jgi:hypothetical protein
MIAFRVQLNGEEPVIAGLSGRHVVSVHADWREGRAKDRRSSEPHTGFRMSITGLRTSSDDSDTHVRWLSSPVAIGDEITIAVVEVPPSEISRPVDEQAATGVSESSERERLAYLLEKYGPPGGT